MSDICPTCGLPKPLCICQAIAKGEQKIKVKLETRKYKKAITLIEGIDEKQINIKEIAKKLKEKFACGGTAKNGTIELQGNHISKIKQELKVLGFDENTIEVE
ncbi:translation initiation factor [Candidatus Woesearchaeota archaeon]|nr:translation initiation factor [Candidatus Woesearchaeota archaeon]